MFVSDERSVVHLTALPDIEATFAPILYDHMRCVVVGGGSAFVLYSATVFFPMHGGHYTPFTMTPLSPDAKVPESEFLEK